MISNKWVQAIVLVAAAVAVLFGAEGTAADATGASGRVEAVEAKEAAEPRFQVREGGKLKGSIGEFMRFGDRIRFTIADANKKLTVLENLAAERVSDELEGARTSRRWRVSGTVTEFKGGNFLLISKAERVATGSQ